MSAGVIVVSARFWVPRASLIAPEPAKALLSPTNEFIEFSFSLASEEFLGGTTAGGIASAPRLLRRMIVWGAIFDSRRTGYR
jgi:hypothetical protein